MKIWRRAAAAGLAAALCLGLLSGCGQQSGGADGLALSVCLGAAPESLDPVRTTAERDMTVLEHLYENLMKISADNSGGSAVTNGLAKRYDVDAHNDGTVTYTFHLRSAKWSDGKAVKAQDFVYAWQRLANPATKSPHASLLAIVQGFDEVQSTGDVTALAVEAKNDSTLVVTLISACQWFLTDVCTSPATVPLREDVVQALKLEAMEQNERTAEAGGEATATWCSNYTKLVTNGPYCVESYNNDSLTLRRNASYTGAAGGPDSITFRYADTPEDGWALYQSEAVDFVAPLPEAQLAELAQEEGWEPVPELTTYTLLFNTAVEPFSDSSVRRAFSLSLDRTVLSQTAGVETRPASGLVPYGVPDTEDKDFRTHGGLLVDCDPENYAASCDEASGLLDRAGYGAGYQFSGVECLYVAEGTHSAVVSAMTRMWTQVLGVSILPRAVTEEEMEAALLSGEYTLAAVDFSGYANDAESFLSPWKSGDKHNVVGYYNSAFDTLLTIIGSAIDETARRGCLHDAEVLLLEDCPLSPLFFEGTDYTLREGLTGVCRDARGFFSFITVAQLQ